jgi:putative FmdB family regulatory protein
VPLYEFECEKCRHRFEKIQSYSAPDPEKCPDCGGGPITRRLNAPAAHFKGSGWYVTDYAKSGASKSKSDGAETSGSATKTETKSETKSEAKTETKSETPKAETKTDSSKK